MTPDKRRVVLSVEQALSMSYATLRMVHLGWRVIRLEATPAPGRKTPGDPNRYIGREVAGHDRHSYYVAPNVGKQAIAIDLKQPDGRALLHRLVRELPVDVFCTNTLPMRHEAFGFDYETLSKLQPELVWCSISAMGCDHPKVPGYDPMIQAQAGYMDLTGNADGPPLQCGPPLIDLKAGDEAFTQVILALLEGQQRGTGRKIDISMARVAVSWLHTFLPMLDMGSPPEELRRAGNEHRQFIPVNAYPTSDGFIYVAVGSDAQWQRLVAEPLFGTLDEERFSTNEGRRADKVELHRRIGEITGGQTAAAASETLARAAIPHSPITTVDQIMALPWLRSLLLRTVAPDGRVIRLPPAAVTTPHLEQTGGELPFAPAYAQHTAEVLAEAGVEDTEIAALRQQRVIV